MRYIGVWMGLLAAAVNVPFAIIYHSWISVGAIIFCLICVSASYNVARKY